MKDARATRDSRYLRMRDGVDVAIDVHLPAVARRGEKVPTIMRQTRYLRGVEWRAPLDALTDRWFIDVSHETRRAFLARGYAWVDVDARGSGASFGQRPCPWHENEVRDGAEVVDWIIGQPWSSGRVGATGVSYEGTTAEMLLVNGHPAVKAVIPQFSLFDAYADVAFPGGIHHSQFTEFWSAMNRGFDRNEPQVFIGMWLALGLRGRLDKRLDAPALAAFLSKAVGRFGTRVMGRLLRGVRRAGNDPAYARVAEAVAAHADNEDVHGHALQVVFRDDAVPSALMGRPTSIDYFSPSTYAKRIDASGAAVLGYGGWWDMGYPHAAIKRHLSLTNPNNRLVIGPWDHGGKHHIGPAVGFRRSRFDHDAEFARFFDQHLKGEGAPTSSDADKAVRYFTMGEEAWKTCAKWPPEARMTPLFLAGGGRLTPVEPTAPIGGIPERDTYRVDYTATTGHLSRWKSGIGMPIDYSDRKRQDEKLLAYDTAPLERDTEVTGHPVVTLHLAADATDAHVFVYLEEVTPSGEVRYVTEGCLRALHRKLSSAVPPHAMVTPYRTFLAADAMPLVPGEVAELIFDLLPTSYLFRRGCSIRLAIAGADHDHVRAPREAPSTFHLHRDAVHPSHLALPIVRGGWGPR
jgi:putative CocE/NonD family hydrolase